MTLLTVDEARARILALAEPVEREQAALLDAAGRWLVEDVVSLRDQPWADLSSMDGYAIRFADKDGPWTVTATSVAGGLPPARIGADEAVRIFTGAPLPEGADAIVIQEDVERDGDTLTLTGDGVTWAGQNVRLRGYDFAEGATVLARGTRLGATQIAVAALAGHGSLPVRRKVRVALVSSGSELIEPGLAVPAGKLPASNAVMLAGMLRDLPAEIVELGLVPDDLDAHTDALRQASGADIVITTGGASVGDHDLMRPALAAAGGTTDFWKIALRPGKPLIAGRIGGAAFLGLPGNPVSTFVTGKVFALPLVRHLAGSTDPLPHAVPAVAGAAFPAVGGRDDFVRVRVADGKAAPIGPSDSAATLALAEANALAIRPARSPALGVGEPVEVLPF